METISNIVSTATSTVSNVIYGQPETKTNETGGKEPVSGQMGKGTIDEPYDQGNSGEFDLCSEGYVLNHVLTTPQSPPSTRTLPPLPAQTLILLV